MTRAISCDRCGAVHYEVDEASQLIRDVLREQCCEHCYATIPAKYRGFRVVKKFAAVLTSTIVTPAMVPGVVKYSRYQGTKHSLMDDCQGVPHYVGHPATQEIVESLGAVKAESNLFAGLAVGESALVFKIAQGKSTRGGLGKTVDQEVTMADLDVIVMTRVPDFPESCMTTACLNCKGKGGELCSDSPYKEG